MFRVASVLLVGLLLAGPAFAKKGKDKVPAPEPAAEAPATAEAGVTRPADLIGEWKVVLSAAEQRSLDVMALVFRDPPPTEDELKAMNLDENEQALAAVIAIARAEDPNDPKIAEARALLDAMPDSHVILTADHFTMVVGDKKIDSPYTATQNADGTLTLQVPEAEEVRRVWVVSVAGDTLSATPTGSPETLHFARKR